MNMFHAINQPTSRSMNYVNITGMIDIYVLQLYILLDTRLAQWRAILALWICPLKMSDAVSDLLFTYLTGAITCFLTNNFYRAMHVVLERYSYRMSSLVRPPVCPSVCLWRWCTVGIYRVCQKSDTLVNYVNTMSYKLKTPDSYTVWTISTFTRPTTDS